MKKIQIVRSVIFLLLICFCMVVLCDLFEQENTKNLDKRLYTYREFPEDTVDGVYIGTSGVDRYWIAAKAYEEYGMTVYPFCTDALPCWLVENVIEEVYEHQNPELLLIDLRSFSQNVTVDNIDIRARYVLDAMEFFSMNRMKMVFKTWETIQKVDDTQPRWDLSYMFSFIKQHSKWAEEDYGFDKNIGSKKHAYAGFFMHSTLSVKEEEQVYNEEFPEYDADVYAELDAVAEEALYDVIEYIKENDLEVLFIDSPKLMEEKEMGRANQIYKILEEEGMKYLTYFGEDKNDDFGIDLDLKKDFYAATHVNFYGAEKYTEHLAAYINENYNLPDRRNDEKVKENWDGVYDKLCAKMADYAEKKK